MFKSKSNEPKSPVRKKAPPSIIAADLDILGNLISDGILDVDGRIEGNVKAQHITIRENGRIQGDVEGDIVHVYGKIVGLIRAENVHLYSTAHVEGTIMHEALSVEDGANVDGKFKRMDRLAIEDKRSAILLDDDDETEDDNVLDTLQLITGQSE